MAELAAAIYGPRSDTKAAVVMAHPTLDEKELELQQALEPPAAPTEAPAKPRRPAGVLAGIGDKAMRIIEADIASMEAELRELERGGRG
jgi:hypothetical protein